MIKRLILSVLVAVTLGMTATAGDNPKREFRGAWLHTVFQSQYTKPTNELKAYLIDQLDKLRAAGVNAVLFQVRPSADALYPSKLEPWSRFLTKNGKAPEPYWDPLQFMVDEAHKRGMELHAWLNPYRVTTSPNEKLAPNHIYHSQPWRFVTYSGDKKMYFDPGLPENRKFIEDVVMDIVNRYDVDAIHFDDYFYPYPAAGHEFPDDKSYAKYGKGMKRDDWRRKNVDLLIEGIHDRIASSKKPWVRFGISPFGIYRNKSTWPQGSNTNGLQNYDALFADVLLWDREGWIDYLLPQLYWELEHKRASTLELNRWWNQAGLKHHLYIGQDATNIMKHADLSPSKNPTQLDHKIRLSRQGKNISGNCWWPGYVITANFNGIADSLANNQQSTIALVPAYTWISTEKPAAVNPTIDRATKTLKWNAPKMTGKTNDAVRFVVYRFDLGTKNPDYEDAETIVAVTPESSIRITKPGIYAVRALNRVNNESSIGKTVTYK